ncbi:XdhC family protein [Natrinema versiforme]|uniref:XdhC family protein n=1 Tax=Natrinema versiforme TaxID=88724 RepID=UPI001E422DED|nr:XdhC/CoxI family protein [Natrinema versiforme]
MEETAALATVVNVEGSGYRRPGAKMVVADDGELQGSVTAGCLEGSVTDLAQDVIADGKTRTETYDLTDDDTDAWGLGLGCNGVIDVLIEPIDESFSPVVEGLNSRRSQTVLTAIESSNPAVRVGDRTVVADETFMTAGRSGLPDSAVTNALERTKPLPDDGAVCVIVEMDDGEVRVFVDRIDPSPELLLFGDQEDINPVASLARQAGFRVRVATARGARAEPDRFPAADEVISTHPTELSDLVTVPEQTYAVLMSHNLIDDQLALDALLDTDIPYVGLMGPRKRFQELREGVGIKGRDADRIATPVGLDLGGDEPTAIGFSIVSELLAVHNNRSGGQLSDREGPIHTRLDSEQAS